jgi:hypothetical protein
MTTVITIAVATWLTASVPVSVVLGSSIRRSDGRPRQRS